MQQACLKSQGLDWLITVEGCLPRVAHVCILPVAHPVSRQHRQPLLLVDMHAINSCWPVSTLQLLLLLQPPVVPNLFECVFHVVMLLPHLSKPSLLVRAWLGAIITGVRPTTLHHEVGADTLAARTSSTTPVDADKLHQHPSVSHPMHTHCSVTGYLAHWIPCCLRCISQPPCLLQALPTAHALRPELFCACWLDQLTSSPPLAASLLLVTSLCGEGPGGLNSAPPLLITYSNAVMTAALAVAASPAAVGALAAQNRCHSCCQQVGTMYHSRYDLNCSGVAHKAQVLTCELMLHRGVMEAAPVYLHQAPRASYLHQSLETRHQQTEGGDMVSLVHPP